MRRGGPQGRDRRLPGCWRKPEAGWPAGPCQLGLSSEGGAEGLGAPAPASEESDEEHRKSATEALSRLRLRLRAQPRGAGRSTCLLGPLGPAGASPRRGPCGLEETGAVLSPPVPGGLGPEVSSTRFLSLPAAPCWALLSATPLGSSCKPLGSPHPASALAEIASCPCSLTVLLSALQSSGPGSSVPRNSLLC